MTRSSVDERISLNFDLTDYLIANPLIMARYSSEDFVVFREGDKPLNDASTTLVAKLLRQGKNVVKATRKKTRAKRWEFEVLNN